MGSVTSPEIEKINFLLIFEKKKIFKRHQHKKK